MNRYLDNLISQFGRDLDELMDDEKLESYEEGYEKGQEDKNE